MIESTDKDQIHVSCSLLNLKNTPETFRAGMISDYYHKWTTITKDRYILDIVKNGYLSHVQVVIELL